MEEREVVKKGKKGVFLVGERRRKKREREREREREKCREREKKKIVGRERRRPF